MEKWYDDVIRTVFGKYEVASGGGIWDEVRGKWSESVLGKTT